MYLMVVLLDDLHSWHSFLPSILAGISRAQRIAHHPGATLLYIGLQPPFIRVYLTRLKAQSHLAHSKNFPPTVNPTRLQGSPEPTSPDWEWDGVNVRLNDSMLPETTQGDSSWAEIWRLRFIQLLMLLTMNRLEQFLKHCTKITEE